MSSQKDPWITVVGDTLVISARHAELPTCLTDSEQAIVRAVLAGSSNAEIAKNRGTSPKTVANQLHAIFRKLGVVARHELVAQIGARSGIGD